MGANLIHVQLFLLHKSSNLVHIKTLFDLEKVSNNEEPAIIFIVSIFLKLNQFSSEIAVHGYVLPKITTRSL